MMQGFQSWSGLQRFVPIFSAIRNLFVPSRSHRSALAIHRHRLNAMAEWTSAASALACIYQLKTNADPNKLP